MRRNCHTLQGTEGAIYRERDFESAFWGSAGHKTGSAAAKLTRLKVKGPEMSNCLHCEINQLVQQHLEARRHRSGRGGVYDGREPQADLILLAPEAEQANLMAYVVAGFGQMSPGEEWRGGGRLDCHSLELGRQTENRSL